MIDHVSLGVSDIESSRRFYAAILAPLGFKRLVDLPGRVGFGKRYPELWLLARPAMARVADDTGCHVSLRSEDRAGVDAFHATAIEKGGMCDGEPRLRAYSMANAYAAFIRDPDGNRVEAVHLMGPTQAKTNS
ncbi:MAG: VOC family protein [Pseudomonadota bacterium]